MPISNGRDRALLPPPGRGRAGEGVETHPAASLTMHRLRPEQRAFAQHLRANATDVERALWRGLRGTHFEQLRFRRQHPIGRYIVDFACVQGRLVIELDGGQHADSATDPARDRWLASQGWRILRFWNHDVLGNLDGVLSVIGDALVRPPPQPSPCPGEGANAGNS